MRRQTGPDRPFEPTRGMLRYLDAVMSKDVAAEEAARAEAAGVSVRSPQRWRADPQFAQWFSDEMRRRLTANVWEMWVGVGKQALAGNLTAAKLYLARFDPEAGKLATAEPETFYMLAQAASQAEAQAQIEFGS